MTAAVAEVAPVAEVAAVRVPERSWRSDVRAVRIVWRRDLIRFSTDRMRIVTLLVQPLLFLFVLGSGLQTLAAASTDGVDLTTFIFPGVLCLALVFSAIFSAATLVPVAPTPVAPAPASPRSSPSGCPSARGGRRSGPCAPSGGAT